MKLVSNPCALCGGKNGKVLYKSSLGEDGPSAQVFSARRTPDKIHYRIVKCSTDGLVRSDPILPPSTLHQLYKKSMFTYGDETDNLIKTYLHVLEPLLKKLPKNALILEVGCGNGFMLEALKKKGFHRLCGIEPSKDAIHQAPSQVQKKIMHTTFERSSLKNKSLDAILLFQTFDHLAQPGAFLKKCYALLNHGGHLLSFHHNVESLQAKILKEKSPIIDVEHTFLYSKKTSKALFEKYGYTVESIREPLNYVSLSHVAHLSPLPQFIKKVAQKLPFSMWLPLGNLCILVRK